MIDNDDNNKDDNDCCNDGNVMILAKIMKT